MEVGIGLNRGWMSTSGRLFYRLLVWNLRVSYQTLFGGGGLAEKLKGLIYVTAEVRLQADGWYIGYHVY